jgi:hypothetical protein
MWFMDDVASPHRSISVTIFLNDNSWEGGTTERPVAWFATPAGFSLCVCHNSQLQTLGTAYGLIGKTAVILSSIVMLCT